MPHDELNGITRKPARIVLDLEPVGETFGQYKAQITQQGVEGGWPVTFAVLLAGLGLVVNQLVPGQPVGNSPVFQAMCGVFQAFFHGVMQMQKQAPMVERATALPGNLPAVKDWLKN